MTTSDANWQILTYLVTVFSLRGVFYVLMPNQGGLEGGGAFFVLPRLWLWLPALAALLATFVSQRNLRGPGWGAGKTGSYLPAHVRPNSYADLIHLEVWLPGLIFWRMGKSLDHLAETSETDRLFHRTEYM